MRNPLIKRLPAQLRSDLVRYIVIFVFVAGMIALVSGFLATDESVYRTYEEGFEKYNVEDGNFELAVKAESDALDEIEDREDIKLYESFCKTEEVEENGSDLRIYINRGRINLAASFEGSMPEKKNEIAIDRMYADNNDITVGDILTMDGIEYEVCALIALSDYSCLFENNTDMMFDAKDFGVAVVTDAGFKRMGDEHLHYVYSWVYDNDPADEAAEKEASDDLKDTIIDETKVMGQTVMTNYIPRYLNNAINFTGDDMKDDKASFEMFFYIVIVIIAFIFAVTASATIRRESAVIGTLRAIGYTRGELIRHYMALPLIVTVLAAAAGNILGYTVLEDYYVGIYFHSYSLAPYVSTFSLSCFLQTTAVPFVMMLVINLIVLEYKLRLSPVRFLRKDTGARMKKKAVKLSEKISFMARFRIRVIFSNMGAYIVLACGIFLASVIMIFGFMWGPLFSDYTKEVSSSMISDYQYVLKAETDTENEDAEKYAVTELETMDGGRFASEEITVYGISGDSSYVTADLEDGIYISSGYADKYELEEGDTITLKEKYEDEAYTFKIDGIYDYTAALSVFMKKSAFNEKFDHSEDYYNGYFSNEKLKDLDDSYIASTITQKDYTKIADQLDSSLGSFVAMFKYLGAIMFIVLVYLLAKQVIDRNVTSVSLIKVLGYRQREINRLYIAATSIVVVLSLLIALPVTDQVLRWMFHSYIYTMMSGYIPYIIGPGVYVKTFASGIACYIIVILIQMFKIGRIPGADAIKSNE